MYININNIILCNAIVYEFILFTREADIFTAPRGIHLCEAPLFLPPKTTRGCVPGLVSSQQALWHNVRVSGTK